MFPTRNDEPHRACDELAFFSALFSQPEVRPFALETLMRGFAGNPKRRYLPEKDMRNRVISCAGLQQMTMHVLGPSRDPNVIYDMNPPAGESFLTLLGISDGAANGNGSIPQPFGMDWVVERSVEALDQETRSRLERIHDGLETKLALALDNALNNTSLVLMFVIGNVYLLFSGDAQGGTWREIMEDENARRLLRNTTFYKVGHHGSHNATPVSFVDSYLGSHGGPTWAMVPVTPYAKWPEIPRAPLLKKIKSRTRYFIRSDEKKGVSGFERDGEWCVDAVIPIT